MRVCENCNPFWSIAYGLRVMNCLMLCRNSNELWIKWQAWKVIQFFSNTGQRLLCYNCNKCTFLVVLETMIRNVNFNANFFQKCGHWKLLKIWTHSKKFWYHSKSKFPRQQTLHFTPPTDIHVFEILLIKCSKICETTSTLPTHSTKSNRWFKVK
jgi:hypothetical protein